MQIKEVCAALDTWAPLAFQESYDNVGLLVGDPNIHVTGVLVTLDVTDEVLTEAKERGCNLVVAHHPVLFKGLKKITGGHAVERLVIRAIKEDIALYASHTNLDSVQHGVSVEMAKRLSLENIRILQPQKNRLQKWEILVPNSRKEVVLEALFEAGAGQIGAYDSCSFTVNGQGSFRPLAGANPFLGKVNTLEKVEEVMIQVLVPSHLSKNMEKAMKKAHPYEEVAYFVSVLENVHQEVGFGAIGELVDPMEASDFLVYLKDKMRVHVIRHTAICKDKIRRVAVCGGAGVGLLSTAKAVGADVFISADFKYHDFFEADKQLIIADIGHFESEQFTKDVIVNYLSKNFTNFVTHLSQVETNPITYFV